jgi:hypothetical protein
MHPVSKQRLGKHVFAFNTPPQQQKDCLFYVVRAATVTMQWCGKHATAIERLCFLCRHCRGGILKTIVRYKAVEGSVVEC